MPILQMKMKLKQVKEVAHGQPAYKQQNEELGLRQGDPGGYNQK